MQSKGVGRVSRESLRVTSADRPGWHSMPTRIPTVGQEVLCTEGTAQVVSILGRTSDGSRLLELRVEDHPRPFFASSSNILVRLDTTT